MPNFEDRDQKPRKRGESKEPKHDEGRRSPGQEGGAGRSYGSPASGERSERQPRSHHEGSHPEGPEERPGRSRKSPHTEEEEEE